MIKQLQQYIKNKKSIEGSERQILGSDAKLKAFASFWEQHGDDLMMVVAVKMSNFTQEEDFDRAQLDFYRKGISEIGIFFHDCWMFLEKEAQKKKLENKSSKL